MDTLEKTRAAEYLAQPTDKMFKTGFIDRFVFYVLNSKYYSNFLVGPGLFIWPGL